MARQADTNAENTLIPALATEVESLASKYDVTIDDAQACLTRLMASVESEGQRNPDPHLAFNEFPLCLFADALDFSIPFC
ncbi:MAG: hypothetical protein OSA98_24885 [Rubripirellula sp.]|nr:hypothetical protein [Rubripirellula sp.]MDE0895526.1 hypothetical protein [Planctomycetota bacterium]